MYWLQEQVSLAKIICIINEGREEGIEWTNR